jgi:HD-GYP domain-containing protein (c-di-GMP phosphodiesterase class II)
MVPTLSLEVGMYICTNIYDSKGTLLLAKDNVIDSDMKLRRIIEASNYYTFIDTERGRDLGFGNAILNNNEIPLYSYSYESNELIEFAEEFDNGKMLYNVVVQDIENIFKNIQKGNYLIPLNKILSILKRFQKSIDRSNSALFVIGKIFGIGSYLLSHTFNVTVISMLLAKFLEFTHEDVLKVGLAGFFHDIGQIMVSEEILNKTSKLTDEEWDEVKKHPIYSVEIVRGIPEFPSISLKAIFEHHERSNGSGYPKGLKGESISKFAQIVSVADVFDALTSKRPYNEGLPLFEGISVLYQNEEMKSDIVNRFISLIGVYPLGTLVKLTTGEVGIVISVNHESLLRPKVGVVYDADRVRRKSLYEYINLSDIDKEIAIEKVLEPRQWEINVPEYIEHIIPENLFK